MMGQSLPIVPFELKPDGRRLQHAYRLPIWIVW
jgi:hypothetical protein